MTRIDSTDIDTASVDAALTSTRAVRRRLDLEREVDHQLILDCIDLAEQAPTGGNLASRRWIVVRDPKAKARLAELYLEVAGRSLIAARDRLAGTGHQAEPVMGSAAHLAEHLADVPVIVIPTIVGRYDGSGHPGLFDSVIQAAWSFCLALRARGLGSAWTTAVLGAEDELAEIVGIPATVTPIVMLPVAWTVGTAFSPAPRRPAREITYLDRFGRTFERGPSDPARLADGPGVTVEVDVDAPLETVWQLVSDINVPANFSSELLGAEWIAGSRPGPALGASFIGRNVHPAIGQWSIPCFVDRYEEGRLFGWCTSDPADPGARWWFELQPMPDGVRLRYSMVIGPGRSGLNAAIESMPDKEPRILARRVDEHRANMELVLRGIKDLAEQQRSRPGI
jgi:nitroreductase